MSACCEDTMSVNSVVAVAVPHWRSDRDGLLVNVESHGRDEALAPGSDLSERSADHHCAPGAARRRTRGAPEVSAATAAADVALRTIKEQLRAPGPDGLGYALARF